MSHRFPVVLLLTACTAAPIGESAPVGLGDPVPATGWRRVADVGPVPAPQWGHSFVYDPRRDRAVLYSGLTEIGLAGEVWAFSLATERWEKIEQVGTRPPERYTACAIADPGRDRMILFGGTGGLVYADTWAFSFADRTWTQLFSVGPSARFDCAVATDGRKAWVVDGFGPGPDSVAIQDLWELDLATDTWRILPELGTVPRATTNPHFVHHDGRLYLTGGHDQIGNTPGAFRYDLATGLWETLSPAGDPGAMTHGTVVDDARCGEILVAGGDGITGDVGTMDALVLAPELHYARMPSAVELPARRHTAAVLTAGRQLLLFGGTRTNEVGGWHLENQGDTWLYSLDDGCRHDAPLCGSGRIAFKAPNGYFVAAENGGFIELVANRSAIGDWETFGLEAVDATHVALRSSSGRYVSDHGDGLVLADAETAGQTESFRVVLRGTGPRRVALARGDRLLTLDGPRLVLAPSELPAGTFEATCVP